MFLGDTLDADGAPLAVAFFPDAQVFDAQGQFVATSRKVIAGNARGYAVKTWLEWPKVSTITASTVLPGRKPADEYAVPLAVSPDGKRVVVTGPINKDTGTNVLWAWAAGSDAGNQRLEGQCFLLGNFDHHQPKRIGHGKPHCRQHCGIIFFH